MPMSRLCGGSVDDLARRRSGCCPLSGLTKPASTMSSVVLPEPEGPSSVMNSPLADVEADIVERREDAVGLGDVSDRDRQRYGGPFP